MVEAPALYLLPLSKRARCRKSLTAAHAGTVGAPLSFVCLRCCVDEVSTLGFQVSSSPTPPAPTVFASASPPSTWDDAQSSVQDRSPTESQPARLASPLSCLATRQQPRPGQEPCPLQRANCPMQTPLPFLRKLFPGCSMVCARCLGGFCWQERGAPYRLCIGQRA